MKNRLITNWTWVRALYLVFGIVMLLQTLADRQWLMVLPALYVSAMGLFGFGCASGNCFGGQCQVDEDQ